MLSERAVELLDGVNFGVFTTLREKDGFPTTQVMWVGREDDHVLSNTELHRRKYANAQADPRCVVTVWKSDNPYSYVEIRGEVVETIGGQRARDHIDELSRKYRSGRDYDPDAITSERVILKIRPVAVHVR
jgi:PPOX class probable F420-dependent enzyme